MSAAQESPPAAGELDRFEAQRQAFSRLMARFTADRDAMIAAVQQCNERIDSLAARLGSGQMATGPAAPTMVAEDVDADELRGLSERLMSQQQTALAEARTASDRALQRADEALRRWRETAEAVNEKGSGVDSMKQVLDKMTSRLGQLEQQIVSQKAEPAPVAEEVLARQTADRLASVEELLHGLEDSVEAVRQQADRPPPPPDLTAPQIFDAGLRDLREQMSHLEAMAAWTPKLHRLWVSLVASAVVAAFAVIYVH